jgi:hypothetical protein
VRSAIVPGRSHLTDRNVALSLLGLATLGRLLYAFVNDPFSGPDATVYDAGAAFMAEHGYFVKATPGVSHWPLGYGALLSLVYRVTGDVPRAAMIAQVLVLAVGSWFAWRLATRELGRRTGMLTLLLLCASPALAAASTEFMYETPMLTAMAIGFDCVSRAARATDASRARGLAVAGLLAVGVASIMQPKAVAAGVLAIVWLAWRRKDLVTVSLATAALALMPGGLAVRMKILEGHFSPSTNLGPTMIEGFNPGATGGFRQNPDFEKACSDSHNAYELDRAYRRCAADWALHHPVRSVKLGFFKVLYLFSPTTGPLAPPGKVIGGGPGGEWFHAFDPQRFVPASVRARAWFVDLTRAIGYAWWLLGLSFLVAGIGIALRDPARRAGALLLVAPIAAYVAIHVVTIGVARFRLPIAPFYVPLQALVLVTLWDAVRGTARNGRRGTAASA